MKKFLLLFGIFFLFGSCMNSTKKTRISEKQTPLYPEPVKPIMSYDDRMQNLFVSFYTTNLTQESIRVSHNGKTETFTETNKNDLHHFKIPLSEKGMSLTISGNSNSNGIKTFENKIWITEPLNMRFTIIGNIESGYNVSDSLIHSMLSLKPDFVVSTGNLTKTPASPEEWIKLTKHLAPILKHSVLMNTPAPSEVKSPHIRRFFYPFEANHRYYSYNLNGTSLIFLDTTENFNPGSVQFSWFTNTLKNAKLNWKVVFTQMPVRSSVSSNRPSLKTLIPTFEKYRVNLVFSGRDAVYERFHINGVIYITTGLGGARPEKLSVNHKLRKFAFENIPHFTEVRLTERKVVVTVYDTNLNILDSFKIID